MAEIVPALLAQDPADYGHKMTKLKFAQRVHLDIAAPPFTPNRTINLAQVHLPSGQQFELHLMLEEPLAQLETVISLNPALAIVHFEAKGNLKRFFSEIAAAGIKKGLAILPETSVSAAAELINQADHVLVFTGHLGYYGGELKWDCLGKIAEIKKLNPKAEVSVDGGVNPENAKEVVEHGADVLVSGGFIANAESPVTNYRRLAEAAGVL